MKLKGRTHRLLPPMSQLGFIIQRDNTCISRQNSWRLRESSNHPRLSKKQVVRQMKERNEMWQWSFMDWIPFLATPKERKKWQAKWPSSEFKIGVNVSCVWSTGSIEKNGSMSILGSAICWSHVLSLVERGLWHMQISASLNWYKRSNLSIVIAFVASQ